jgi:hypothetical protein
MNIKLSHPSLCTSKYTSKHARGPSPSAPSRVPERNLQMHTMISVDVNE